MRQHACRLLKWTLAMGLLVVFGTGDPDCDFTFSSTTTKSGTFFSPNYPGNYPNNKQCIYKFVGLTSQRVKMSFNKFRVQGVSPECPNDYLDIYVQLASANDLVLESPMLGRFCGDDVQEDIPKLIISTSHVIVIIFFSDDTKNDDGFEGYFEFIDAGIYNVGTLISPNSCSYRINSKDRKKGFIVSPTFPGAYPNNLNCTYELHGSPGERIKLTFVDFSIFHGDDYCPFDYVLIKDGRASSVADDIGLFCGKYEQVTVFSSREYMCMEFVTRSGRVSFDKESLHNNADYKFDRKGFNISYEFSTQLIRFDLRTTPEATHIIGTECDVRITSSGGSSGNFQSPGFPGEFPKNTTCKFHLDGEMNAGRLEKVKVMFKDFFISGTMENNCTEGFLGVTYEGHRKPSFVDEIFCGHLWPPELTSKDPRMILTLDTHNAFKVRFSAEYQFLSDYAIPGKPISEGGCNFLFESRFSRLGTFNSPRHPNNYPPNIECVYIFRPESRDLHLLISFDTFNLDPSLNKDASVRDRKCRNTTDFLELYVQNDSYNVGDRYQHLDMYCGDKFPAPIVAHKEIKFRFRSMTNSSFHGFKARYEFIPKAEIQKGCVQEIYSDGKGGIIKSPRFPLKYERKTYCEWKIIASKPQNKILIQLVSFKIDGAMTNDGNNGINCKDAVLRLQHGQGMIEICGSIKDEELSIQGTFISTGDMETIQFLTASTSLGFKGFQLTWTELHFTGGTCYGFLCKKTLHCISSDLRCNDLPNCGSGDNSDEICPTEEPVQVVHIVIGTSISVFFCVTLLVCGVYHRKKLRPRDRHAPDNDHMEVHYVAASPGSNTTDRLLTMDKPETSTAPGTPDQETCKNKYVNDEVTSVQDNHTFPMNNEQCALNRNHAKTQDTQSTSKIHHSRPVLATKIQKVSIV